MGDMEWTWGWCKRISRGERRKQNEIKTKGAGARILSFEEGKGGVIHG